MKLSLSSLQDLSSDWLVAKTQLKLDLERLVKGITSSWEIEHDANDFQRTTPTISGMFLKLTVAQTITNATETTVTFELPPTYGTYKNSGWDSELQQGKPSLLQPDSAGVLNRLSPQENGLYLISANIEWEGFTDGVRRVSVYDMDKQVNIASTETTGNPAAVEIFFQNISVVGKVTSENRLGFQIKVYQTRGGNQDVEYLTGQTWAQITRIGNL